jgi:hypothetical protein
LTQVKRLIKREVVGMEKPARAIPMVLIIERYTERRLDVGAKVRRVNGHVNCNSSGTKIGG